MWYYRRMDRFNSKVTKTNTCWLWTGAKTPAGYGKIGIGGCTVYAHRYAYEQARGPIPPGHQVCHICDNPSCVNPDHLFSGTQSDNEQDKISKGRRESRKGENNHNRILTEEQVRAIRGSSDTNVLLGFQYGVDPSTISRARNGKQWTHLK